MLLKIFERAFQLCKRVHKNVLRIKKNCILPNDLFWKKGKSHSIPEIYNFQVFFKRSLMFCFH